MLFWLLLIGCSIVLPHDEKNSLHDGMCFIFYSLLHLDVPAICCALWILAYVYKNDFQQFHVKQLQY